MVWRPDPFEVYLCDIVLFCFASTSAEVSNVIMLLLSRGSDPNVSSLPLNPMFYTILGGEVGIVKKLLQSGARTDQYLPDEVEYRP